MGTVHLFYFLLRQRQPISTASDINAWLVLQYLYHLSAIYSSKMIAKVFLHVFAFFAALYLIWAELVPNLNIDNESIQDLEYHRKDGGEEALLSIFFCARLTTCAPHPAVRYTIIVHRISDYYYSPFFLCAR